MCRHFHVTFWGPLRRVHACTHIDIWYGFWSQGGAKINAHMSMGQIYVGPHFLFIVVWHRHSDLTQKVSAELRLQDFQTQTWKITLWRNGIIWKTLPEELSCLLTGINIVQTLESECRNWNVDNFCKTELHFGWACMTCSLRANFWKYVSQSSCYIV